MIVCGGLRTERDYLCGLKDHLRNPAVTVRMRAKGLSPKKLVDYACCSRVASEDEFDEVWCVVDVDAFELDDAAHVAAKEEVCLAVSNPCFELWLLLHHQDWRRPLSNAHAAQRELQRHVATYKKDGLRFDDFAPGISDAVMRAQRLDPTGCEHSRNPSSSVWRLVQRMSDGP